MKRIYIGLFYQAIILTGLLVFLPLIALAAAPSINHVEINYADKLISVYGNSFGTSGGTVKLSGKTLTVQSWTNTLILANYAPTIPPGSYTLTITVKRYTASIVVKILDISTNEALATGLWPWRLKFQSCRSKIRLWQQNWPM